MINSCIALSPTKANFAPLLYSGDIDQGFKTASEMGYDGVELNLRDSKSLDQEAIAQQLEDLKLKAVSFGTGQSYFNDHLSLADPDASVQKHVRQRMHDHIEFASKVDAMVVIGSIRGVLDTTSKRTEKTCFNVAVEAVRELAKFGESHQVKLLLEPINRYETNFINTISQALDFIDEVASQNLYVLPDTFHMNIEESNLVEAFRLAGKRLGHIHLVDSNRCAPGMGHINFSALISTLKDMGYGGYLSGEMLPLPDDYQAMKTWLDTVSPLIE